MKKTFIFVFVLLALSIIVQAQEEDKTKKAGKGQVFVSVSYLPTIYSKIDNTINTTLNGASGISQTQKYSPLNFKADLCFMINENWGVGIGYSMHSYKSEMKMASFSDKFSIVDSENEPIVISVGAKNIMETQDFNFFDLPLYVKYQKFFGDGKFGVYGTLGIILSSPIKNDYKGVGTFTYSGYYPSYNVTLKDLPKYDYPTDTTVTKKGSLKVKTYLGFMGSLGVNYKLGERTRLFGGLHFNTSITDVSSYNLTDYKVSERKGDYNSLMSVSKKSNFKQLCLEIGVSVRVSD
jgi:hypothetical protein